MVLTSAFGSRIESETRDVGVEEVLSVLCDEVLKYTDCSIFNQLNMGLGIPPAYVKFKSCCYQAKIMFQM